MNSLSITELVHGVQYRIYSNGGCKEMETTVYRTFFGINEHGDPLFYDNSMGCPVNYGSWTFYRI
jgi:hypothetical protein